jgi:hypothetical protein
LKRIWRVDYEWFRKKGYDNVFIKSVSGKWLGAGLVINANIKEQLETSKLGLLLLLV